MPKEIIEKFQKQYGKKRGKEVYYATANKQDRNPETFEKKEETSVLANTDVLTEAQKEALKGIIDQIVEERAKEQNKNFISQYTEFIVEQATKKLTDQMVQKFANKINEEISVIKDKTDKVCRAVVLESSTKIAETKAKHQKLVEEFKNTAPQLIDRLAEKKAQELSEDAILAIQQNEKLVSTLSGIVKGMESVGYVINEDTDGKLKQTLKENLDLKTKIVKAQRDLKLAELSEGMLPAQKKEVTELLSECTTSKMVEDKFNLVRDKVMKKEIIVEEKEIEVKKPQVINEEQSFSELIGMSKKFMQNR